MIRFIPPLLSGVGVDLLATLVFYFTAQNKAFWAATTNTVLTGCILYVFVDISKDNVLAIPYLAGIWIGGILGIELKKKLEKHDPL